MSKKFNNGITESEQWGIELPSGEIAWDTWQGADLSDNDARMQLRERIINTARELGFDVDDFLGQYQWAARRVTYHPVGFQEISPLLDSTDANEGE